MEKRIIPRVAAIHDISGFGKVSLSEVLPILSSMGVEVCPLPTAVLSTHTYDFKDYSFCDLTEEMPEIIQHWERLGISFDAIYSGYMGSARQVEITYEFMKKEKEKGTLAIVDPVMGDNALLEVQSVYSDRMLTLVDGMKKLTQIADVITPNVTEACMLLGREYTSKPLNNATIKDILKGLCELGTKAAIITSVMDSENSMCVAVYDREKFYKINCGYVNRLFHGTGDIYTSVLTGCLVKGMSIIDSSNTAADFVYRAIQKTIRHPQIKIREGVLFEQVLAEGYFAEKEHEQRYVEI